MAEDLEQNVAEASSKEIFQRFQEGTINFEQAIKELKNISKNDLDLAKKRLEESKLLRKAMQENAEVYRKSFGQKNGLSNTWKKFENFLAGNDGSKDSFEQMYRTRQRFSGFEQLLSGNFKSGLTQIAGSFTSISRIMNGPYMTGLLTVITTLAKFDDALAKSTKTAISLTGGLRSDLINQGYFGRGGRSLTFLSDVKSQLYKIGMQGEFENITKALTSGYGMASYAGNQKNFIETMGYAQKGLGAYGISPESSNSLLSNLRLIEGKNQQGVYAQLQRLTDRFSSMSMFSPEQALQQATSLYDQTKNLGTNFEWASKTIKNFEVGLKNGTLALSDFAAMNRAFQSGGVQKNAGTAALLTEFASRSGINLPSSFLRSNVIGQGFALSSPRMLGNNNIARAMSGKITEMLDQMQLSTEYERAGGLQHILSQLFGINISSQAALNSLTSSGSVDLIKSGVAGSKALVNQLDEQNQAEQFKKDTELYYTASTSWHKDVLTKLGNIANNTESKFGKGLSGDVSSSGNVAEFAGFFVKSLFTKEYWTDVANIFTQAAKSNPATATTAFLINNGTK